MGAKNLAISISGIRLVFLVVAFFPVTSAKGEFTVVINSPPEELPVVVLPDTQVNLFSGAVLPSNPWELGQEDANDLNVEVNNISANLFLAPKVFGGARFNIDGGFSGFGLEIRNGGVANLLSGEIGDATDVRHGGTLNVEGGVIGRDLETHGGSIVNASGGEFQHEVDAFGGHWNISGGTFAEEFTIHPLASARISGGVFSELDVLFRGQVEFVGRSFLLDGIPIEGLTVGTSTIVAERNVTLSGEYPNGSPFSFQLNGQNLVGESSISISSVLTVTLVPEPSGFTIAGIIALVLALRHRRILHGCEKVAQ